MYLVMVAGGASVGLASLTARRSLKTLVITKEIRARVSHARIENQSVFEQIGGFDLISKFEFQAKLCGA